MKRLVVAVGLIALIVAACITENIVISHYYEKLNTMLNTASQLCLSDDLEGAHQQTADLEKYWEESAENVLSLFVNHNVVDQIGYSIAKLEPSIISSGSLEFTTECKTASTFLKHMKEDEEISLTSIF
ncbi:MAG: DUF4363 family protein [Oscillospiraceae bacterium]|nr:DUF4363 family protein [Oscillospiraceae bacterium]